MLAPTLESVVWARTPALAWHRRPRRRNFLGGASEAQALGGEAARYLPSCPAIPPLLQPMRHITCVTRSPAALSAAAAALSSFLRIPLPPISPLPSAPDGVLRCALPLRHSPNLSLELLHIPPSMLPFAWRGAAQVHLVGAHLCARAALDSVAPLLNARSRVAGLLHTLGIPAAMPLPRPLLHLAAGSLQPQPRAPPQEGELKEIVLGVADGESFAALQATLAAVAARTRSSLSVWDLSCGTLPLLRLLPSSYSALIFHAGSLGERSASPHLQLHGQRHGVEGEAGSGQLRLRHPALEGLDVRVCAARGPQPAFAEDEATLTDVMDPGLNNMHSKSVSLACKSIVGMDLISTLKLRVSGRVN